MIIVQIKSWPNEWKHYQQFGIFMLASYGSLHITEQFIHVRAAKLLQKLNVRRKNGQIITVLVEEKVKRKIFFLSTFESF